MLVRAGKYALFVKEKQDYQSYLSFRCLRKLPPLISLVYVSLTRVIEEMMAKSNLSSLPL